VYPRKLIPQRRTRVNYGLYAANGNTIATYGWLSLSLNLGLRREFTWRFVVADVTQPLIGADFLTHLLVDCRNNRLLDVTSLSTPAQAASPRIPSIKVINTGTSVDALLSELPDLIRPTAVQWDVRHNTVHHKRTPPGPPVTCRPRRLATDRLKIAKVEIDAMVRDGTARSHLPTNRNGTNVHRGNSITWTSLPSSRPTPDISLDKTTSSPTLSLASNVSLRRRHTTYSLQHRTPTMNFEHSWSQTPPYG
jgi:hypothetical protein